MGSFRESLDLFIDKEIEDSLRGLRKFDKDYDNICKNHAEASSKYEDIINNLSASNKEFIENFKNEMYIIEAKAQD